MIDQIFKRMADGYLLLVNETDAVLVSCRNWNPDPRPDVLISLQDAKDICKGKVKQMYVGPLSQFQWGNKVGWRELVGSRGEKYDVFGLVQ